MDEGIATSTCLFKAFAVDGDPNSKDKPALVDQVCDAVMKQFVKDR